MHALRRPDAAAIEDLNMLSFCQIQPRPGGARQVVRALAPTCPARDATYARVLRARDPALGGMLLDIQLASHRGCERVRKRVGSKEVVMRAIEVLETIRVGKKIVPSTSF
jgi:hypothetical protein